jgi:hypothetical protein
LYKNRRVNFHAGTCSLCTKSWDILSIIISMIPTLFRFVFHRILHWCFCFLLHGLAARPRPSEVTTFRPPTGETMARGLFRARMVAGAEYVGSPQSCVPLLLGAVVAPCCSKAEGLRRLGSVCLRTCTTSAHTRRHAQRFPGGVTAPCLGSWTRLRLFGQAVKPCSRSAGIGPELSSNMLSYTRPRVLL